MMKDTKVADQAWIAVRLLQREFPDRADFQTDEILKRAKKEFGELAPGVRQHLGSHAIASNPPSPGKYRMFTRTGHGRLRLYRVGDPTHPERTGKIVPNEEDIPEKYRELLRSYLRKEPNHSWAPNSGSTPSAFLAFVGFIPAYDLKEMEEVIARDCERIEGQGGEGKDAA
jgi:hypothetical protein